MDDAWYFFDPYLLHFSQIQISGNQSAAILVANEERVPVKDPECEAKDDVSCLPERNSIILQGTATETDRSFL